MPSTLPPWLRNTGIILGLAIIVSQAVAHLLFDRFNLVLVVVGAVMVGLVSPDKLDRFLPAPAEPPVTPPPPPPTSSDPELGP